MHSNQLLYNNGRSIDNNYFFSSIEIQVGVLHHLPYLNKIMQTKHMSTNDLEVFPDHRGSGQYSNTVRKSLQFPFESYPAFLPVTKLCLLYYAFM